MNVLEKWPLVAEVLQSGPPDGHNILLQAQNGDLWETLYLTSRSSQHVLAWREAFGRQRPSQDGAQSVLELAVKSLTDQVDSPQLNLTPRTKVFLVRLIANCCADNDHNRKVVLHSGGLLPLIKLLAVGADPNALVPTIYNVCFDLDEPAEHIKSGQGQMNVTLAEERLARTDMPGNSVYSGIITLLHPRIVLRCNDEIKEYLADLIETAARPAVVLQDALADLRDGDFGIAIERLLASDGGVLLAEHSAKCRASIIRSLISVSTSSAAKAFLASSRTILAVAFAADCPNLSANYLGEDEDERKENLETINSLQDATLKLAYEVCQMSDFRDVSKYGLARQSLAIACYPRVSRSFLLAVAYIVLYAFINSDVRAHLMVSESLIPVLVDTLKHCHNKTVIHPALAVATKLAATWSLRGQLYRAHAMQAVHRLLTESNLGFEIPLNAITFCELMIKGHPEHVQDLVQPNPESSILLDVFAIFKQGQDAICFEVGRLAIELCATMGQHTYSMPSSQRFNLDSLISAVGHEDWSKVLVHMVTKLQGADLAIAQRVWFALGLLSTSVIGQQVVLLVLRDPDVRKRIEEILGQGESHLAGNIKYTMYNLRDFVDQSELDDALRQMSLS